MTVNLKPKSIHDEIEDLKKEHLRDLLNQFKLFCIIISMIFFSFSIDMFLLNAVGIAICNFGTGLSVVIGTVLMIKKYSVYTK
jgi:uncharacterized membrane protein (DUF485 family)